MLMKQVTHLNRLVVGVAELLKCEKKIKELMSWIEWVVEVFVQPMRHEKAHNEIVSFF